MIFLPEHAQLVLDGHKTVTRRMVPKGNRCRYAVGGDYSVQPGRGKRELGRIVVVSVVRAPLGMIDDRDELLAEGYTAFGPFYDAWTQLHGEFDPEELVDRIEFRLVSRVK